MSSTLLPQAGSPFTRLYAPITLSTPASFHQRFKGRQIGFAHILFRYDRVKLVPQGFRAGVHGVVLGAGGGLERIAVDPCRPLTNATPSRVVKYGSSP